MSSNIKPKGLWVETAIKMCLFFYYKAHIFTEAIEQYDSKADMANSNFIPLYFQIIHKLM